MDINEILEIVVARDAEDLHIRPFMAPTIRCHGRFEILDPTTLRPAATSACPRNRFTPSCRPSAAWSSSPARPAPARPRPWPP